jgi:hypothetical protein
LRLRADEAAAKLAADLERAATAKTKRTVERAQTAALAKEANAPWDAEFLAKRAAVGAEPAACVARAKSAACASRVTIAAKATAKARAISQATANVSVAARNGLRTPFLRDTGHSWRRCRRRACAPTPSTGARKAARAAFSRILT